MSLKVSGRTSILAAALLTAAVIFPAKAQENAGRNGPVLVELFASQACSSCVAAAELITDLAGRDDVVALSWHVDYWDKLQTAHGRWADPYSDPVCTERQRAYNRTIRNRSSVYTPQMVVNGSSEAVGSSRKDVARLIEAGKDAPSARIEASANYDRHYFEVSGAPFDAEAFLVTFKPKVETMVARGENAGVAYADANVVTGVRRLGAVKEGGTVRFSADAPEGNDHCALIIQAPGQGPIAAAAYCAGS